MRNARRRFGAIATQRTGHLYRPVGRDIIDVAVMRHVNVMLGLLIIVNGVNHFTGGVGVIGPAALLQLFRFHVKIRILIELEKLFLNFLHYLRARAAFVVLAHFNRQHLFWLKVVEQIGARDQAQRPEQPFAKRQIKDIFHRVCAQSTRRYAVKQLVKA